MTRREWLAITGLAMAGGCGPKRGTGYPGFALISTAGDSSVSVVDLTAFSLAKTVRLNAPPAGIVSRIAPAPGLNYVLTPSNGSVHVLDGKLAVVASRRFADELSAIRLMPDGARLIAISKANRQLLEIDAANLSVIHRYQLNADPAFVDVSETGHAAVSTGGYGTVELVDVANRRHYQVHLEGPVGQLRFRKDGKMLLTANLGNNALTALTVPDLQVIADLALAMKPENLCFNFDQGQLFVSGAGMDAVAIVFPYQTLVDQTVLACREPGVMNCSERPPYLFVASTSGPEISILNIDSRKVVGVAQVGQNPSYITVTPDSQYALVLDKASGDMAVIHIPAIRSSHSKSGGLPAWASLSTSLFTMLPVGDKPVEAVVVPRSA